MGKVRAWLRQPTTVGGMSAVLATVLAVVMQQITWAQAIPLLAGALMSIILPDDSAAKQKAEDFAARIISRPVSIKEVK